MSDKNLRPAQKIHMASVEELLGVPKGEATEEIEIKRIHSFANHPFKVRDDEKMADLIESIRANGVLSPVLVRPDDKGGYEMISGHRRMHAAQAVGLEKIPAIVKDMDTDEATIAMVDANIQREEILPSERAWALKMKMDAMRRQGARAKLSDEEDGTCRHDVDKLSVVDKKTASVVGSEAGLTGRTVQRYIRLTQLKPELLDMVDTKRLQFVCAVDISYFSSEVQQWIYEYIKENGVIKPVQIAKLKAYMDDNNPISQSIMIDLFHECIPKHFKRKYVISEKQLDQYFPSYYTDKQIDEVIFGLLDKWSKESGK